MGKGWAGYVSIPPIVHLHVRKFLIFGNSEHFGTAPTVCNGLENERPMSWNQTNFPLDMALAHPQVGI